MAPTADVGDPTAASGTRATGGHHAAPAPSEPVERTTARPPRWWRWPATPRAALVAFVVYLVFAFWYLLEVAGRGRWFVADEWGFLVNVNNPDALFRPQNQHWSTLPILAYRVLFHFFGLQTYRPYLASIVLLHLTLAVLLRVVMRRAGVGPWIATVMAAVFVLYGPGKDNILLAVQISMVGTMVLGFTQLILADHDGGLDRRDWLGLLAGALALTTSGIALVLVPVVGLSVLIRRGLRPALFHTVPLGTIYLAWYLTFRSQVFTYSPPNPPPVLGSMVQFAVLGESGVFLGLGHYTLVAVALGVALVVGLVMAWLPLDRAALRRRAAAPAALLTGAVMLFALVSVGRAWMGADLARTSRYIGMSTAMTLPALGVAVDALVRRWRALTPILLVSLLVAGIANLSAFSVGKDSDAFFVFERQLVTRAAFSPLLGQVPRSARLDPDINRLQDLDAGWLLDAKAHGKVPRPPAGPDPWIDAQLAVRLGIVQDRNAVYPFDMRCTTYTEPLDLQPTVGQTYGLTSDMAISAVDAHGLAFAWVIVEAVHGTRATVALPNLHVRVTPAPGETSFTLCT